eukprot:jgi/Botrbrau1/20270/Bobra.31_1s0054.2
MKYWQAVVVIARHVLSIPLIAWVVLVITMRGALTLESDMNSMPSSNPASISPENLRLALLRSWWATLDFSYITGLRTLSVKGALTKDQLRSKFPTDRTLIGPAVLETIRIYGSSLNNPRAPSVAAVAGQLFKAQSERVVYTKVSRIWSSASVPAEVKCVEIGLAADFTRAT